MSAHIWIATLDTNGARSAHATIAHSAEGCIDFAKAEITRMIKLAGNVTDNNKRIECEIVQIHRAEAVR